MILIKVLFIYHMKKIIKKIFIQFITLLLLVSSEFLFIGINTSVSYEKISSDQILKIINNKRIKADVYPLLINKKLTEAANNKAQYLIDNKIFEHNSNNKKFSDWAKESGYTYSFIGENLAENFKTSDGVVEAWLKSENHKKNLLNKNFTETGISIVESNGRIVIVQIFGRPGSSPLLPEQIIKNNISENIIQRDHKFKIYYILNLA